MGAVGEGGQVVGGGWIGGVEVLVGPEDEVGEGRGREGAEIAAGGEAGVAKGGRGVHADEEEEGAAEEEV